MERFEANRLEAFHQLKKEIPGSTEHLGQTRGGYYVSLAPQGQSCQQHKSNRKDKALFTVYDEFGATSSLDFDLLHPMHNAHLKNYETSRQETMLSGTLGKRLLA